MGGRCRARGQLVRRRASMKWSPACAITSARATASTSITSPTVVGTSVLMAGLAASGYMTPAIALAVLVAYLLVASEVFLSTAVQGVFRMSFLGFGPTELRILLAAGAIALLNDPRVDLGALGRYRLFDFGGTIAAAGLMVALATAVTRNTVSLARLEPRPRRPQSPP